MTSPKRSSSDVVGSVRLLVDAVLEDAELLSPAIRMIVDASATNGQLLSSLAAHLLSSVISFGMGTLVMQDPWSLLRMASDLFYGSTGSVSLPSNRTALWPDGLAERDGVAEHLFCAGSRLSYEEGLDLTGLQVRSLLSAAGVEPTRFLDGDDVRRARYETDNEDWAIPSDLMLPLLGPRRSVRVRGPEVYRCPPTVLTPIDPREIDCRALTREIVAVGVGRLQQRALALWPCVQLASDTPVSLARAQDTRVAADVRLVHDFAIGRQVSTDDFLEANERLSCLLFGWDELGTGRRKWAGGPLAANFSEPYQGLVHAASKRLA